jgi:hypothetical protein
MQKIKRKYAFIAVERCLHLSRVVASGFVALFLGIALFTAHTSDSSLLCYPSQLLPVSNGMGFLGAHISALLFYLFGGASWALVALSIYLCACSVQKKKMQWDRYAALLASIFVLATMAAFFMTDSAAALTPGGFVGKALCNYCVRTCDVSGTYVLLFVVLYICLIIGLGINFFVMCARACIRGMHWCGYHRIVPRLSLFIIARIEQLIASPIKKAARFLVPYSHRWFGSEPHPVLLLTYEMETDQAAALSTDAWEMVLKKPTTHARMQESAPAMKPERVQIVVEKDVEITSDNTRNNAHYTLPDCALFAHDTSSSHDTARMQELKARATILEKKLERFGVEGRVVAIKCGPVVTLFEYKPTIDSKISKIVALEDDLALALQALSIRILAPIPGSAVVGFEVANNKRHNVLLGDIIRASAYTEFKGSLPLLLGKNTVGEDVVVDLATMPHVLVAGSTGSGKSVALNAMLVSLLCKKTPQELQLILIDPKRLEFAAYADIAHLIFPIVTNPKQAAPVLQWVVKEMEERYAIMAAHGARNLADYNNKVSPELAKPLIVVVIDELADLMMTAGKDVEMLIARIAQMARAAGIHMIVATQRPSVDVITGLIKVNFPSRISFRVISKIDSRTILDCAGADKLLGKGDMLFLDTADSMLKRVHGAYVSDKEIAILMQHIRAQQPPAYRDLAQELPRDVSELDAVGDVLYDEVLQFLQEVNEVSISLLQRKFRIGYNRSARIIEQLESRGLVIPSDGGKTRKVVR